MGAQEQYVRKRTRVGHIEKIVLKTILATGFLTMAVLAPNALQVLGQFGFIKKERHARQSLNRAVKRLQEKGLVVFVKQGDKRVLRLTRRGERELREVETRQYQTKKPRRWDKKWRIIIFDIPEKRKAVRERLRYTLVQIGFKYLQNSVWIYPYDCEDLIQLLKADFKIGRDVLYIIADSVEDDKRLKSVFGLEVRQVR